MRICTLPVCVVVVCAASLTAVAGQQPQFTSRTELIRLDVSVVDKDHQPVRGLTREDFTLLEDGKAQAIQSFAAIDLPDNPPQPPGWLRDVAPDVTSNTGVDEDRLIVIVMDDYITDVPQDLYAERGAKEIGRGIVERLGPRDLAAVVYTVASKYNQEFTHDRARLLAAVEHFNPGGNPRGPISGTGVLSRVCDVLGSVTERRKILVWVTPIALAPGGNHGAFIEAAQRANVNVYPIDPAGMRAVAADPSPPGAAGAPGDFRANVARANELTRIGGLQSMLSAAAARTGGHSFQWSELKKNLAQVFRETGSFYLLGYASSNAAANGKLRKIEVKTTRKGATVNTRDGYFAPPPPDAARLAPPPPSPAFNAVTGLVPARAVPVRISAAPFVAAGSSAVAVALSVPPPADAADDVDVVIEAFTFDGVLKQSEKIKARLEPARAGGWDDQILAKLDLSPGRYQLRAGVTSARRNASGSVYADLDVPDFSKAPLALSGVILNPVPAPRVVSAESLVKLLPVMPSTVRTFSASSSVASFTTVYQRGQDEPQPVTITASLRNEADKVVFTQTATVDADRFAGASRSADYRLVLPLGSLTAGEYLVTFDASAGKAKARRDVRITIR